MKFFLRSCKIYSTSSAHPGGIWSRTTPESGLIVVKDAIPSYASKINFKKQISLRSTRRYFFVVSKIKDFVLCSSYTIASRSRITPVPVTRSFEAPRAFCRAKIRPLVIQGSATLLCLSTIISIIIAIKKSRRKRTPFASRLMGTMK